MTTPKKIAWLVALLVVLGAAGYGISKWSGGSTKVEYSTATVSKGTVTDSIEATGTLGAIKETAMGFKNDDIITALNVQPGDHVTAGQVLAEQDPATLTTALRQAQSTGLRHMLGQPGCRRESRNENCMLRHTVYFFGGDGKKKGRIEKNEKTVGTIHDPNLHPSNAFECIC